MAVEAEAMAKDRKPTVMIIDENPGVRELYAAELAERGYDVVAAGSAEDVEEAMRRSKPDLIILDPWIEGRYRWDVLWTIKEGDSRMPVLLCLAFDAPVPEDMVLAEEFILKSMFTTDLIHRVERIIRGGGKSI
jgi:DNA-binding NtrC family response regulator